MPSCTPTHVCENPGFDIEIDSQFGDLHTHIHQPFQTPCNRKVAMNPCTCMMLKSLNTVKEKRDPTLNSQLLSLSLKLTDHRRILSAMNKLCCDKPYKHLQYLGSTASNIRNSSRSDVRGNRKSRSSGLCSRDGSHHL